MEPPCKTMIYCMSPQLLVVTAIGHYRSHVPPITIVYIMFHRCRLIVQTRKISWPLLRITMVSAKILFLNNVIVMMIRLEIKKSFFEPVSVVCLDLSQSNQVTTVENPNWQSSFLFGDGTSANSVPHVQRPADFTIVMCFSVCFFSTRLGPRSKCFLFGHMVIIDFFSLSLFWCHWLLCITWE